MFFILVLVDQSIALHNTFQSLQDYFGFILLATWNPWFRYFVQLTVKATHNWSGRMVSPDNPRFPSLLTWTSCLNLTVDVKMWQNNVTLDLFSLCSPVRVSRTSFHRQLGAETTRSLLRTPLMTTIIQHRPTTRSRNVHPNPIQQAAEWCRTKCLVLVFFIHRPMDRRRCILSINPWCSILPIQMRHQFTRAVSVTKKCTKTTRPFCARADATSGFTGCVQVCLKAPSTCWEPKFMQNGCATVVGTQRTFRW